MKHILLLTLIFLFSGCVISNPFVPPKSTQTTYGNEQSYPTEPIRTQAMYRATMRPYTVNGIRYTPIVPSIGQTFTGIASWYGPNFHGNKTSNGEYYDMNTNTAAHKTLPMNTLLQVTNLDTQASTIVRINDRGPFVKNRILDLSHQAALELGVIKKGTAHVKIEVVDFDTCVANYAQNPKRPQEQITPLDTPQQSAESSLYKIQIASLDNKAKATELMQTYASLDGKHAKIKSKTFWQRTHYKVLIGDFDTVEQAENFINEHGFNGAFVVKD